MIKPGTIVVCLKCPIGTGMEQYIKWLPTMDESTPYMIREVFSASEMKSGLGESVRFEEGVIGFKQDKELCFPVEYVREILPPENITEQIKEIMYVPIEL